MLRFICIYCFASYIHSLSLFFFFFNDTATTEIYTLSLHDALPIWKAHRSANGSVLNSRERSARKSFSSGCFRSEEHTSELQSRLHLVCRLLLEKKKHHIYHKILFLDGAERHEDAILEHDIDLTICE